MLVLTRKDSDSVIIHVPPSAETTTIEVTIARIISQSPGRAARVRLGFNAVPRVKILRKELECHTHQAQSPKTE